MKDFVRMVIRNLLHENIDVHSKIFITEFRVDGIKCISKLQSHCDIINFSGKVDMIGFQ